MPRRESQKLQRVTRWGNETGGNMKSTIWAAIVVAAMVPSLCHSELAVLKLSDNAMSRRPDVGSGPSIVIRLGDWASRLESIDRIDSVYLRADVVVTARGSSADPTCLRVSSVAENESIRSDSSFHELYIPPGSSTEVVCDLTDLFRYWKRDPALPRLLALTACLDDFASAPAAGIRLQNARIELRHSRTGTRGTR